MTQPGDTHGTIRDKRQFVVYVAGPYSADSKREVMANVFEAIEVAAEIRRAGFTAIVPHLESLFNEDCISEEEWLDHGFALLRRCSAVVDFRKGRRSQGTEKEVTLATILGIPVVTSVGALDRYINLQGGDQCRK